MQFQLRGYLLVIANSMVFSIFSLSQDRCLSGYSTNDANRLFKTSLSHAGSVSPVLRAVNATPFGEKSLRLDDCLTLTSAPATRLPRSSNDARARAERHQRPCAKPSGDLKRRRTLSLRHSRACAARSRTSPGPADRSGRQRCEAAGRCESQPGRWDPRGHRGPSRRTRPRLMPRRVGTACRLREACFGV